MENILIALVVVTLILITINLILTIKNKTGDVSEFRNNLKNDIGDGFRSFESLFRDEFKSNREEVAKGAKESREIISGQLSTFGQSQASLLGTFQKQLSDLTESSHKRFNEFRETSVQSLGDVKKTVDSKMDLIHQNSNENLEKIRKTVDEKLQHELVKTLGNHFEVSNNQLRSFGDSQSKLLGAFQKQINDLTESNMLRFKELQDSVQKSMVEVKEDVNKRLESIRIDSNKQLDKMRETVDEKLQKTLEHRLGKSFELVSKQLEAVQKGLGEMQNLATGVGDLKKVLGNVRTRGTLGEIQLISILEQILSPEQYSMNVATIPNSRNHVEIAIKLPGKEDSGKSVWLPIDSKFPMDRYSQLQDAIDSGDKNLILSARKTLSNTVKSMAKDIKTKYIAPPHTTDFGILFLPTEGLFADVVRDVELVQTVQQQFKIMLAGPTNLAALLNSLQMGFRSLAIEKRSSEVWQILSAVKSEFGKFGGVIQKVQKKLQEASNTIDQVGVRSRAIERNLRDVQELPASEQKSLPFDDGIDMEDFKLENSN